MAIGVGGMGNPFEFREIMKASFHFNETRTVDEVIAEQEANRNKSKSRAKGSPMKAPDLTAKPSTVEMDKLRAMLAPKPLPPPAVS